VAVRIGENNNRSYLMTEKDFHKDNTVTEQQIENLLNSATTEEQVFHGKEVVVSYQLPSRGGFTVTGRGACVDPTNFDIEVGRKVAREDVANQLWKLEGYLLSVNLYLANEATK